MPSWHDAGGSQAARVLFEGGQRLAAGLDGGSGRSRRGQDIPIAPDDHIRGRGTDRRIGASPRFLVQPGEVPVSSSWDTALANCAGANGFSIRTLPSTPCDFQSGALALVM